MKISEQTKISALIQENKDSIDAISSLAKPLEKLKNPLLRKLMASRVTIGEAAKMADCPVSEFYRVLLPLGFETDPQQPATTTQDLVEAAAPLPQWLQHLDNEKIHDLDVRGMLAEGHDPLKEIMQAYKEVPEGEVLRITNTFVPTPLVHLLENKNALTYTVFLEPKRCQSYFLKQSKKAAQESSEETNAETSSNAEVVNISVEQATALRSKYTSDKIREMDVRNLEMPGPMLAILEALETLKEDSLLFVNHKKVPIYLLEELAGKGFQVFIVSLAEGEVKLLIKHNT